MFAAASAAEVVATTGGAVALVAGVGLGSLAWGCVLTGIGAAGARWATPRVLRGVDAIAGAAILAFGAALGVRAARD